MQEPRRRSWLEQYLLPLSALVASLVSGCTPRPSTAPLVEAPETSEKAPEPAASAPLTPASTTAAGTDSTATEMAGTPTATSASTDSTSAPPPDPASYGFPKETLILHIGDSFAGSLGVPLGKRFKAAG